MRLDELFSTVASAAKPLYVNRPLENAAALRTWARAQGFQSCLADDDFHVTIAYSKAPVDWSAIPPRRDYLRLTGGPRQVRRFGEAVVLCFTDPGLEDRWQDLCARGCSWDHPSYRPHLTISYAEAPPLSQIAPYTGPLLFGPERFAEISQDWADDLSEQSLAA